MIIYCVHDFLFMLPAPFCSTLLSLQLGKKFWQNIYNEREKNEIVEKQFSVFFLFFLFVCISFFFRCFFFLPFVCFFFLFFLYLRELSPMISNKQTNKKIQSYQLALHSLREVLGMEWRVIVQKTVGWTQKGGIGGGGRRSIKFMRGWKFKKFKKTDGCAADGA